MMDTEKLRKADIFSGTAILLLGLFIVTQAFQMPMKDSYAGVQNVWYVSPALFPLFVGAMLTLLGILLMRTALKEVGLTGLRSVFAYFTSQHFILFLKQKDTIRYYAIILNLLVFVFLFIPRVDFFLASLLFLLVFFFEFYCTDHNFLLKLIFLELLGSFILICFILLGIAARISETLPFLLDYLICAATAALILVTYRHVKTDAGLLKKFKLSLVIAFAAPFTIGVIFKYFLLVPMPFEGLVVTVLDAIWWADFWS
ncbi:MAG: hypothetical protein V2I35_03675 [Desulfocapsaceae bacterium]|jgi:hypothetical protein|nr:hypothetical protein [Desulfocapsaceae bacterium]